MPDQTTSNILDLQSLAPTPMQIKLPTGETVDVQPPKMQDTIRLSSLGTRMQNATNLSDDELDVLNADITKAIVKMIPQLDGTELNANQTLGIITMLAEMGVPASAKELKASGVEVKGDPKADSN